MSKRKLKQNHQASDDEMESQRPVKQLKKQNSTTMINTPSLSRYYEYVMNSNDSCSSETSSIAETEDTFDNFTSFLKAFSFKVDSDDDENKNLDSSQNEPSEFENTRNDFGRKNLRTRVVRPSSSTDKKNLDTNIRIISVSTKLSEIVIFDRPASITLHGYVKVTVWLGKVSILGYNLKEGESIKVLSTEGTGLKKAVALKSVHKSTWKDFKNKFIAFTCYENDIDLKELHESIGPKTSILKVKKIPGNCPLRFLELYYPNALQTRWSKSSTVQNVKNFELCSTKESYTIDISEDYEILSDELSEIMSQPVSDEKKFGPRIMVLGEQKLGKSTLIRYLMNSALNKYKKFYFLDTDLGQTEYTPPGVVSLYQVTKPLLGPPFAHQKKALKMMFVGGVTPATIPELFETSIECLMKYFNCNYPKETLFVNTMGWCIGIGKMCLQFVKDVVKPTVVLRLVPPDPNLSLEKEVKEDGVTFYYIPSKAPSQSRAPSYSAKEMREFNITAYFGQLQKPHWPACLITSFRPAVIGWNKIALYVMGKKTNPERLVESIHGSLVALCCVDLSYVLESDNPELPLTLSEYPVCECLGFGIVRASDEINRLFYVITPLKEEFLEKVNALVKGEMEVPINLFAKQKIYGVNLPFSNFVEEAKHPGLKPVQKRAFRYALNH